MKTQMPSDHYFRQVKSKEDYDKLVSTGMAWEVEPNCPGSWAEHKKLKSEWEKECEQN